MLVPSLSLSGLIPKEGSYARFHLVFTVPIFFFLLLVCRRFLSSVHRAKIVFLSVAAVLYTTLWDNFIVAAGAWSYEPHNVIGVIGYVPIEEYFFFVIQTTSVALLSLLIFRWGNPKECYLAAHRERSYFLLRWVPTIILACGLPIGAYLAVSADSTFYLGMIVWWVSPVLAWQWWFAGPFIAVRPYRAFLAVAVPTVYFWVADHLAIQQGIWIISPRYTTGFALSDHLPIEEALFFLATNCLVVFGYLAFDRAVAVGSVLNLQSFKECRHDLVGDRTTRLKDWRRLKFTPSTLETMKATWFVVEPRDLDSQILSDLWAAVQAMSKGSLSFSAALQIYPEEIWMDVIAFYGICRITDDIVDEEEVPRERRSTLLHAVRTLLEDIDACSKETESEKLPYVIRCVRPSSVEDVNRDTDAQFESALDLVTAANCNAAAILRLWAYSNGPRIVGFGPVAELFRGYYFDLGEQGAKGSGYEKPALDKILTDDDVVKYAEQVAASVGEGMVLLMHHHFCTANPEFGGYVCGNKAGGDNARYHPKNGAACRCPLNDLVKHARDMGVAFQFVNCARDIVTDARIGRVYVPSSWFKAEFPPSDLVGNPDTYPRDQVRALAERLLQLAEPLVYSSRRGALEGLPGCYSRGVIAASDIYWKIAGEIRAVESGGYIERARTPAWWKVWVLIRTV